jgi:hypothetical protein
VVNTEFNRNYSVGSEIIWREREKKETGQQTRPSALKSYGQGTEYDGRLMGSVRYIAFLTEQTFALKVPEIRRAYYPVHWAGKCFLVVFCSVQH